MPFSTYRILLVFNLSVICIGKNPILSIAVLTNVQQENVTDKSPYNAVIFSSYFFLPFYMKDIYAYIECHICDRIQSNSILYSGRNLKHCCIQKALFIRWYVVSAWGDDTHSLVIRQWIVEDRGCACPAYQYGHTDDGPNNRMAFSSLSGLINILG